MAKNEEEVNEIETGTGEILSDPRGDGKERPWREYKKLAEILHSIFLLALKIDPGCISPSALYALSKCSTWLLFARTVDKLKLQKADFCRGRLCPVCNWRRAQKMFAQMLAVAKQLQKDFPASRYLFLTLTVRNCSGDELSKTLDRMNDGFKLLVNAGKTNASSKLVKANLLGYARATEITYNIEQDTYHPHFHVLLQVKSSFFSTGYIKQSRWTEIWQDCMKLDYTPVVDIRVIKSNEKRETDDLTSAISETMKYPVKPDSLKLSQFPTMNDEQKAKIVQATAILNSALHSRRLVTFGGSISKTRRQLKLDDVESGDLIHVEGDEKPRNEFELVLFRWKSGAYIC